MAPCNRCHFAALDADGVLVCVRYALTFPNVDEMVRWAIVNCEEAAKVGEHKEPDDGASG